jgi:peptide/nickel transport system permease protein
MTKLIRERLLLLIPMVLGIIFIVFFLTSLLPSSPGRIMLGANARQEEVDKLNAQLGYNKPFFARYFDYVWHMIQGDFGVTYFTRKPVFAEIWPRFPVTFKLASLSMLLSCIIGLPIGVYSAVRQYSAMDYMSTTLAMFLAVIPSFWFALILLLFFTLRLGWLPSSGASTPAHYVMPVVVTALGTAASLLRMTRTTMLETIRTDYVRTARAKGVPERRVIWRHALKNALLPVLTIVAMNFAFSMGGTVITESVFSMPGLGMLVITSLRNKDIPLVMGIVVFFSLFFLVLMLLIDVLYGYIDPRIKARYEADEVGNLKKLSGTWWSRLKRGIRKVWAH